MWNMVVNSLTFRSGAAMVLASSVIVLASLPTPARSAFEADCNSNGERHCTCVWTSPEQTGQFCGLNVVTGGEPGCSMHSDCGDF